MFQSNTENAARQLPPPLNAPPLVPIQYAPKPPPRTRKQRAQKEKQIEIERIFDPIHPIRQMNIKTIDSYWEEVEDGVYRAKTSALTRRWVVIKDLETNLTPLFMRLLRESMRKSFKLRHMYNYQLRNIEDAGELTDYQKQREGYKKYIKENPEHAQDPRMSGWEVDKEHWQFSESSYLDMWHNPEGTSPLIERFADAEAWLNEKEEERLKLEKTKRPNTKWVFDHYKEVELKAIVQTAPLLGNGRLPDWLRKQKIISLDTYEDNLCLWRCIAVHRGATANRSTQEARRLAKEYGERGREKTPLEELERVERNLNLGRELAKWEGFRVYEPVREENEVKWELIRAPPEQIKNVITIGKHGDHAFLIKSIEKLGKNFACAQCQARFTKTGNLQRHVRTCTQGKTRVNCPGEQVEAPQTAYEKAFYPKPKGKVSKASLHWLEYAARKLGIEITHAMSGKGGERWIENGPVDGYNHKNQIVFQYHGCYWHGCSRCYPNERDKILSGGGGKKTKRKNTKQPSGGRRS